MEINLLEEACDICGEDTDTRTAEDVTAVFPFSGICCIKCYRRFELPTRLGNLFQRFIDSLDMEDEEDFLLYERLEQFKKEQI